MIEFFVLILVTTDDKKIFPNNRNVDPSSIR